MCASVREQIVSLNSADLNLQLSELNLVCL